MTRKLTTKQKLFVEYYIQTKNGVQAAEKAGYKGNYNTLKVVASENLAKPYIAEAIGARFADVAMDTNEVLGRLASMARGFDIIDYLELRETFKVDKYGEKYFDEYVLWIDLEKIRKDGFGHLIKRIAKTSQGITIEQYDSRAALVDIGKAEGLFPHKIDLDAKVKGVPMQEIVKAMQEADEELEEK